MGEACAKYLHKGDKVTIIGDLVLRTYTDTNGQKQSSLCVNVDNIEFQSGGRAKPREQEDAVPDDTFPL